MFKKQKEMEQENAKLKKDLADITETLGKTPEQIKKDLEDKKALEQEIEDNKKLLEQAKAKEKEIQDKILGGSSSEKITDEEFKKTKENLERILQDD